jgi:putative hemolysin
VVESFPSCYRVKRKKAHPLVDIKEALTQKYPLVHKLPTPVGSLLFGGLKKLFYEEDINAFLQKHRYAGPFEFIEQVLEHFRFSYKVSSKEVENIPASGRVVIIANHPLGALDALSLIDLIHSVRSDIKVVANDVLAQVDPLKPILIPLDVFGKKVDKEALARIYEALDREEAVIIFPSGEVSRARPGGIKDTKWQKGFLKFALKKQSPILPVYIKAKNSALFYTLSSLNKKLSTALLVREMFRQEARSLEFRIGEMIPYSSFARSKLPSKTLVKLFQKHLHHLGKRKPPIFATQRCIAHPESKQRIKEELRSSERLGSTGDKKAIYLFEYRKDSAVMREIARLRELTFRKVEEGTGKKRDMDEYDTYYKHIVLWDEEALEIVGSYRIGESDFIREFYEEEGFYSHSLFRFTEGFTPYLHNSIELGRSFVQPKYWGSRALDYLWQGIGAYLHRYPHIRYMFGPVSLSGSLPKGAKNLIVFYYDHYYGGEHGLLDPKRPFVLNRKELEELRAVFSLDDAYQDFQALREQLSHYGVSVPTLYKQYTELCEPGGIRFLGFNVDPDFNDCVDSFILVDIDKIKAKKKERYIK